MKHVSVSYVLELHTKMIEATGGKTGILDIDLLESALFNAFTTFDGVELYPGIEDKCANICFSIIKDHPFTDGNKRMGIYLLLLLLEYNDIILHYTQPELIDLGSGVANGRYQQGDIVNWIKTHTV